MQRSDVFQILDEHIEDFQTPAVDERITRWIGGLHGIPSPHPPSSLADARPPYRHRLRPRPRPPLATIQASTQQQPVNRKRKRNPMDTASKNPEGKDTGKAKSFPEDMMEERAAPVQNSGRTTRSQTAVPQNLSSLPAGNPRRPGNANGLDVGSTVNIQGHSGALDHVPDLNIVPRPAKAASHPNRPQSRSTASKSKTSGGSQSSSVLSSRQNPSMDGSQNSTSSRVVTSKESLALMSPPVLFVPLGCINEPGMKLPSEAQTLWWDYVRPAIASSSYIPNTLKTHLDDLSSTPSGRHPQVAANAFCTPAKPELPVPQAPAGQSGTFVWHPADHEMIREHIFDIHRMANDWRNKCDEDYWIEIVVAPLMHLVRKMTNFHHGPDKRSAPRLSVINLKTREIKPDTLISTSDAELFKALNKKIDLAVGLRLFRFQEEILQTRSYVVNPAYPSINQVQSCFNFTPMFVNAEVKKKHQNRDPLIHLGAWVAAEFNKRYREGWPLDIPVVAIAIEQDEWLLYIVHHIPGSGGTFKLRFVGPISIGTTVHYDGIFRILFVLCTLGTWGDNVYRQWFYKAHGLTNVYEGCK
ncbi:MAG: hypothetical protein LQ344_005265 [Seirophora lacunosa]|nr:MAG: hypothetical protein LQ344_005265 [Seirophora lacunosa]